MAQIVSQYQFLNSGGAQRQTSTARLVGPIVVPTTIALQITMDSLGVISIQSSDNTFLQQLANDIDKGLIETSLSSVFSFINGSGSVDLSQFNVICSALVFPGLTNYKAV